MAIVSLDVQHFRTHQAYSLKISPTTTLITGMNGSGKTSLIEALHIALQGSSFKGSDTEVLQYDAPWYRIDVGFDNEPKRTVKFDPSRTSGKKQFTIDNKNHYRLPVLKRSPVVLFEPDDLRLLQGSPSRRRQFIDMFISQIQPHYASVLRKYERALKQRNNLLKHHTITHDELFIWNIALSEYGAVIISERIAFIERLNSFLTQRYGAISKTDDTISIHYSHTLVDSVQQKLLNELTAQTERDKLIGYTSHGPHRHDVVFYYNGKPAAQIASRGENRTIILAIKFIEAELIESLTGQRPLLLLDDVFSELDSQRQESLIGSDYQSIITAAAVDLPDTPSISRYSLD